MEAFSFAEALRRLKARCPAAAQAPCVQQLAGEEVRGEVGCDATVWGKHAAEPRALQVLPPLPAVAAACLCWLAAA